MARNMKLTQWAGIAAALLSTHCISRAAEEGAKQPVFLLCPHASGYSAWSLYVMVDSKDPKKVLSLGLEKLRRQNSKDSSFEAVHAAQKDEKVQREPVASINAADFGTRQLRVEKDDALHVGVGPDKDGAYRLSISLRISADERFNLGENSKNRTQVLLTYDAADKAWHATAKDVFDDKGAKADVAAGSKMNGLLFPVTGTGIFTIVGMFDSGDGVTMLDRSEVAKRGSGD